jgi:hypothetical protein
MADFPIWEESRMQFSCGVRQRAVSAGSFGGLRYGGFVCWRFRRRPAGRQTGATFTSLNPNLLVGGYGRGENEDIAEGEDAAGVRRVPGVVDTAEMIRGRLSQWAKMMKWWWRRRSCCAADRIWNSFLNRCRSEGGRNAICGRSTELNRKNGFEAKRRQRYG